MIDLRNVNPDDLSMTVRMIRDEIFARRWDGWLYYLGSGQMRLKRADGKIIEIFNSTPSTTSFVAGNISTNKYLTHLLYRDSQLPTPETYVVATLEEALRSAGKIFSENKKAVVKPIDSAHGNGISVSVAGLEELKKAYKYAKQYSKGVIIQEHLEKMIDVRLTCINYKFVAGLIRLPARVTGDGLHSIKQLINLANQSPKRGENYRKSLNIINLERAVSYLGNSIEDVPASNEIVSVLGTANLGTGGETIDITESLPEWLVSLAERASEVSRLAVCGVDFLLKKTPELNGSQNDLDPKIIEINKCPALFMHETPSYGDSHRVVKTYIDYLETI